MCHVIDSDILLLYWFKNHKDPLSISKIKMISEKLETSVQGIYVDISMDSLCSAIDQHPELFCWHEKGAGCVERKIDAISDKDLDNWINWYVPGSVRSQVRSLLLEI